MPHAVLTGATKMPDIGQAPLLRREGQIHKVLEVAQSERGWILKCVIIEGSTQTKFLARVDRREDGLLVRLDDHMGVERSPTVFAHLTEIARLVLAANPDAKVGKTNLEIETSESPRPAA